MFKQCKNIFIINIRLNNTFNIYLLCYVIYYIKLLKNLILKSLEFNIKQ